MPKQKLPPLNLNLDEAPTSTSTTLKLLGKHLGGIEVATPEDWEEPSGEFRILVEGHERPDWSRRDAAREAQRLLVNRERKERINLFAEAKGAEAPWEIPAFDSITLCPRCLQLETSHSVQVTKPTWQRISQETPQPEVKAGRYWLVTEQRDCGACPANCPDRSSHRGNQRSCDSCKMQMVPIWTTNDEIPKEWMI